MTGFATVAVTRGRPDPGRDPLPLASPCRDRGAATVWALAVGLALLLAGMAGATLGAAHLARHQAQVAADLAALAGAVRAAEGRATACARAAEFAAANGSRLTGCALSGFDLTVTVQADPPPVVGLGRSAVATARAGPVRADDSARPR